MDRRKVIRNNTKKGFGALLIRNFLICSVLLLSSTSVLLSQVITNTGASVAVRSGTVMNSHDFINTSGTLLNSGTINLNGGFTNTGTLNGSSGTISLMGNWTNSSGIFNPGTSTVVFNGSDDQLITKTGGETFFNMSLINSGSGSGKRVLMSNNVTVSGILSMALGNIDAAGYILYLSSQTAASLNYTSTTGSRILGKFERGIGENAGYLFPLGTMANYNPLNLTLNNIISSGPVLSQFITSSAPGNAGLPVPDPPVEIDSTYPDGFWSLTSFGFSTGDFNISLDAAGFADTVRDITRVVKRAGGGDWVVDGTHEDAEGTVVKRNNLSGNISSLGTDFALGRARPLIISHPSDLTVCEHTNAVFSVTATGAEPLTYRWYHDGVVITNGPHYSGTRTSTLTIIGAILSDAGSYYCIVSDRYRDTTQSHPATLVVMKVPVASLTPSSQGHTCSDISFEDIVMDMTYHDTPGGSFVWTRDNPAGISSAIPLSGTASNLGDVLSGSFTNSTDDPVTVTFTVTPVGPPPTYCVGEPVQATITVNPTPRVLVDNIPQVCYGIPTQIVLSSPTTMTQGIIRYDYTVTATATSPDLIGHMDPVNNLPRNSTISWPYQNNTDTLQSVFFHITPKNVASGCNPGTIVIPEVKIHPQPLQDFYPSETFLCEGGSDATLTAILSKNSKPDIVTWHIGIIKDSTFTTNNNVENLTIRFTGRYWVIVQDSLGCKTTSIPLDMKGPTFNSRIQVVTKDSFYGTTCPGSSDGEMIIWEDASSSAVAPYAYWLVRNGTDTVAVDTLFAKGWDYRHTVNGLQAGHYLLIVRDGNGCYNDAPPEANIVDPDTITVRFSRKQYAPGGYNISCLNYSDGKVWIDSIGGGNGDYTYKWSTFDGLISGPDTLDMLDSIPAGKYYLFTTDRHLCTKLDSVEITEPEGIQMTDSRISLSPDGAFNIACAGEHTGSIEIDISGGSGNYLYSWSDTSGTFSATTKDIHDLAAGTYIATITDQANTSCIMTPLPTFTITEPEPLNITDVLSVSAFGGYNINCHGDSTGSIDITVTGGSTGNYEYYWTTDDGHGIVQGQEDQTDLTAGTYNLMVNDGNGCSKSIEITLTEPPVMGTLLLPKDITCYPEGFNNGSIDLSVTGGLAPYGYSWSDGATTEDISGLAEGTYTVNVTDVNGCQVVDSARINLPPPLEYTRTISDYNGYNITCNGEADASVDITPTSGSAPFIFNWEKAGEGTIATTEDISGITAGQYHLTIIDANQCTAEETINITQPEKLSMTFDLSSSITGGYNINCAGDFTGAIEVTPMNGVGNVDYIWIDGVTIPSRTHLPAGTYAVIITDSNGCQADSIISLTEPDTIKMSFEVTQPWCPDKPDGEIKLNVTGGVPGADYNYHWSDNSTTRDLSDILPGLFSVTVSDLNGCSVRDSVFVDPQQESCLIIPNAISPNDDLINDVWNIGMADLYPQIEVKIFNRWGELIWNSERGYPHPWDGRSNGEALPIDSYHYIIDLHNGTKPIIGNVTIVR